MGIVYVLLPASLLLALTGVIAFIWAARHRQFDQIEVSGARLLFERDEHASRERDEAAAHGGATE
ncbi:MAG: cbb3-type cytochrome oxidase assembly protein CcoS [Myxococcales bacterium]|nr:cbb3-type cytochrome oxidase assembly protein CcoS [Myxococcales bacterium]